VRREEISFQATLELGSAQLTEIERRVKAAGGREITGADAFKLHDTYGFPIEYTVETARSCGLSVDREGFERALGEQRERARSAAKAITGPILASDVEVGATAFLGYDATRVAGCRVLLLAGEDGPLNSIDEGVTAWVVLDQTPFYAESGGQVGDIGRLVASHAVLVVEDAQWLRPGVVGHRVRVERGTVATGDALDAEVDDARRRRIMANHTATHLLHAALREVLGESARQAGSLVAPDKLRFDFTWGEALGPDQLGDIERRVNSVVFAHRAVSKAEMAHADAMARGAVAMFGEKYGDVVRVVAVDDWSVELCGGTHCDRTEQIGGFRILSERGVAAGIRRIEAVTGPGLFDRLVEDEGLLDGIESAVKAPRADLLPAVQRLVDSVKALRRELEDAKRRAAEGSAAEGGRRMDVAGIATETRVVAGLDVTALRAMAEGAREKAGVAALALGSSSDGKASLVLALDKALASRLGGDAAKEIVGIMAKEVGGGGGGRAEMGWAGGKRAENLEAALMLLPKLLEERLRVVS
jgi:alanyl-tRNA synthetase